MSPEQKGRGWKMRVQDILDSINKIKTYTAGLSFEEFRNDSMRIDAVIRNLEIIGEAAGHIPMEVQEMYPNLAWFEMRGMRNIISHQYFGVSIPIIWQTIQNDLDPLASGMQALLSEQE